MGKSSLAANIGFDVARNYAWEPLPDGLALAEGIDLDSPDPAWTGEKGTPRRCVALGRDGGRCRGNAGRNLLTCLPHAGKLDGQRGGRRRAERARLAREAAENRVADRSLGVRGALSAQLQRRLPAVEAAVDLLLDTAQDTGLPRSERLRAAQALLPWLDQALGKPTLREEKTVAFAGDLASLSDEELAAKVAEGRARRLRPAS